MASHTAENCQPRPTKRVQRKRARRIQEILTNAAELFGKQGYDAVSLDDVAARLDVTKGSLYYYFSSKDELSTAAIETLGNDWTERLESLPAADDEPAGHRLSALIHEHINIAVREYPAALSLFLLSNTWPEAQRAKIKALRRRHDGVFRAVVERGIASGEFSVISVSTTLQCMHAAMSQAPRWCENLTGAELDKAIVDLTATLMMLVGKPTLFTTAK